MLIDKFRADGKIALVTGGTRGIGLGIARVLSEAGATVIISSRKESGAVDVLSEGGASVEFRAADMMDPDARRALLTGSLPITVGLIFWLTMRVSQTPAPWRILTTTAMSD